MTSSYTVFRPGERKKRSKDDEDEEVEKEIRAGARTAYDAQRARLERLMKVHLPQGCISGFFPPRFSLNSRIVSKLKDCF